MTDPTKDPGATGDLWRTYVVFPKDARRRIRWVVSPEAWAEIRAFKYDPPHLSPLGIYFHKTEGRLPEDTLFGQPVRIGRSQAGVSYEATDA